MLVSWTHAERKDAHALLLIACFRDILHLVTQPTGVDLPGVNPGDSVLGTREGIANFLGCVPSPHEMSLRVNNVVWFLANQGPGWTGWPQVENRDGECWADNAGLKRRLQHSYYAAAP